MRVPASIRSLFRQPPGPEREGRDLRPWASMLATLVAILMVGGLGILGSASGATSRAKFDGDEFVFLRKQVIFAGAAVVALFCCAKFDYRRWLKLSLLVVPVTLLLLVGVMFTEKVNGSHRWIPLGFFNLQPSELAKIAVAIALSAYISRYPRRMEEFWRGLVVPMAGLGMFCLLVLLEPDYGTTLLLAITGICLLYVGGVRIGPLAVSAVLGGVCFVLLVMQDPVRTRRIVAFLNPERYSDQEAFQQIAAANALMAGGVSGLGLGQSIQKQANLPEPHTDFIFAILGEELGITATLFVLAVFLCIFIIGLRISAGAADAFGRLLACAITLLLTVQALINMAVVTGLMPNKGLPLPFISYGGSSLIVSAAMVGILMNIAWVGSDERILREKNPVKDRAQWV